MHGFYINNLKKKIIVSPLNHDNYVKHVGKKKKILYFQNVFYFILLG